MKRREVAQNVLAPHPLHRPPPNLSPFCFQPLNACLTQQTRLPFCEANCKARFPLTYRAISKHFADDQHSRAPRLTSLSPLRAIRAPYGGSTPRALWPYQSAILGGHAQSAKRTLQTVTRAA